MDVDSDEEIALAGDEGQNSRQTRQDIMLLQTPRNRPDTPFRDSSSPVKITGSYVAIGVNFASYEGGNQQKICKVDKTLVCKGFWEYIDKVGRIHLPRRFGKTYNLDIIRLFFSSSLESVDILKIPDSVISNRLGELDMVQQCRRKREWLFDDSLLKADDPQFFERHFCKHPVVYISFASCKGPDFNDFLMGISNAIIKSFNGWIRDIQRSNIELSGITNKLKTDLDDVVGSYKKMRIHPDQIRANIALPLDLFEAFSELIYCHSSLPYILLLDEYDVPFITVYQSGWPTDLQKTALQVLKRLFGAMFKDNSLLEKGLMVGVFPISLGDLGSGANNYVDVTLVPTTRDEIQTSAALRGFPHSRGGNDALVDSFGFNSREVRSMAEISLSVNGAFGDHIDDVVSTMRKWYNGYHFDRFGGKYNPWSTCFYLKELGKNVQPSSLLSEENVLTLISSRACNYWDKTGSPGLIETQMELYPSEFCELANRLLAEYSDYLNTDPFNDQPSRTVVHLPSAEFSLSRLAAGEFNADAFLKLALHAGYLTIRNSTAVGIPDGELQYVWESLMEGLLLRNVSKDQIMMQKGNMLGELHRGRTDSLCYLATASHGVLANHNKYREFEYANLAMSTIYYAAKHGVLTHISQPEVSSADCVLVRELSAGQGRSDWVTFLHSSKNRRNEFGMIVEFKFIPNEKIGDPDFGKAKAEEGMNQIGKTKYASMLGSCVECIHIGLAIGFGVAYASSQLYSRSATSASWTETDSLL